MSDRFTESLSDYLDGGLPASARAEFESHLRGCTECSETLEGLRNVVARARMLPERSATPEIDLWPGIEARILETGRPIPGVQVRRGPSWASRRVSFSVPQLAAACLALAIVSGSAVWYARRSGLEQTVQSGRLIIGSTNAGNAPSFADATPSAEGGLRGEASKAGLDELRRILADGRDKLDPATVRTLEESLTIIEIAIGQARRALEADPANPYVRAHLNKTMQRKVDLLRRATMLASAP
ncbi:MAG TPA: zf-HC2 domain-containing protein [Candidatus Eisenbacteria bacterium]|nr:zf-HC2 domain-containing protein [Candidatus Eisenbacteria bacterium]